MSSREIAELLEKQHANIKISAERLAEKGVIGTLAVQEFTHNGNVYTEYLLNKRDSLILVAQNCPEFTARIVDRWQELEAQQAPKQGSPQIPRRCTSFRRRGLGVNGGFGVHCLPGERACRYSTADKVRPGTERNRDGQEGSLRQGSAAHADGEGRINGDAA
jgi:hypothetical protein